MPLETVTGAIVAILKAEFHILSGAFDPPPDSLDTPQLPATYVLTGQATDTEAGDDLRSEVRTYRVQFAWMAKGSATPKLRESRIRPYIRAAKEILAAYPTLRHPSMPEGTAPLGILSCFVRGDSGIVVLPEWNSRFVGFEVRVEVTELVRRRYKD